MTSPADPVAAYLTGVRERSESPLPHVTSLPIGHDGVRALMESTADVPRLLAAVEAVLAEHRQIANLRRPLCVTCTDLHGQLEGWPCSTVKAISRALLGKEEIR